MAGQLFIEQLADDEPNSDSYYTFFKDSIGEGPGTYLTGIGQVYRTTPRYQRGYGLLGIENNAFAPHGQGLGSILSSLWKVAAPMIKTGAKKLGSAALDVATNVAADALQGKDIRESAKEHLTNQGTQLLRTLNPNLADSSTTTTAPSVGAIPTQDTLAAPPPVRTVVRKAAATRKRAPVVVSTKRTKLPSKQAKYSVLKYM